MIKIQKRNPIHFAAKILLGLSGVYGLSQALTYNWVCDDAFISFRYAKNLTEGLGLVYNAGEYVEGYTNFLWTLLMAFGMKLGIEPVVFSKILSIASYLAIGAACTVFTIRRIQSTNAIFLPLATICFFLHRDHQVFATSGLETSLFTLFVTAGFVTLVAGRKNSALYAGIFLALASLTRPDGAAFYVTGILAVALVSQTTKRELMRYIIPALVIIVPYWIWRVMYYGDFYPNTYYAKSANLWYIEQGLQYLWMYVKTYYGLFLVPIAILLALWKTLVGPRSWASNLRENYNYRAIVAGTILALPYIFAVVKAGGDFMFARLLLPVTPILLAMLESGIAITTRKEVIQRVLLAVIIVSFGFRWEQISGLQQVSGIADEVSYYPPERFKHEREIGEKMNYYFRDGKPTVAFYGMRATMVYYADPPVAIECQTGLTDRFIAHQEISERGRPGHEKLAPLEYLYEREVDLILPTVADMQLEYDELREITMSGFQGYIWRYDLAVMPRLLRYSDVDFLNFPEYLDRYIAGINELSQAQVRSDYQFFKKYYFDVNPDSERQFLIEGYAK